MAAGFHGRLDQPVRLDAQGSLDVLRWVADNGIDPAKVVDIGRIPNPMMPSVLREMDVALQPSRAEACTNLPVMEAMACGIPVIAAYNTGMKDLLTPANSLPLLRQGPVAGIAGAGTEGWGESDVEEIVAALERAYTQRESCRQLGLDAARFLTEQRRTWRDHAAELKQFVLSL
jgi:glycosyltransferase involved in cell wall biosynthesis